MNPQTATFFLSLPPVRGFVSLMFLVLVTALPLQEGGLGIGARIALCVGALLVGTVAWVFTLAGFLIDVQEPRLRGDGVVVAHRPRRAARFLSWVALGALVASGLSFGVLPQFEVREELTMLCALIFVVAILVASLLPRMSRRYADGAGLVTISPAGLGIFPARGGSGGVIPWSQVGMIHPASSAAESLSREGTGGLGRRVRWRPGAREAVARWAAEGFTPTAAEVRSLHLNPQWSPDPAVVRSSRAGSWGPIAVQGWALLVCVLLAATFLWALFTGQSPWWILLLLGWAPLLGIVVLGPRLLRILRTDQRRPAELSAAGWMDHLHGQGLVPWEHIERIEVRDRHTLVISRAEAPPFRDRDLGNRMNQRVGRLQSRSPVKMRSAGPLFREIGPRHLPYPPETGAFTLAGDAEQRGLAEVRRPAMPG